MDLAIENSAAKIVVLGKTEVIYDVNVKWGKKRGTRLYGVKQPFPLRPRPAITAEPFAVVILSIYIRLV